MYVRGSANVAPGGASVNVSQVGPVAGRGSGRQAAAIDVDSAQIKVRPLVAGKRREIEIVNRLGRAAACSVTTVGITILPQVCRPGVSGIGAAKNALQCFAARTVKVHGCDKQLAGGGLHRDVAAE